MDQDPVDSEPDPVAPKVIGALGALTLVFASFDIVDKQAREYVADAVAANSRRDHRSDWKLLMACCAAHGLAPLPAAPSRVARFLTAQAAPLNMASLHRRLGAIVRADCADGHPTPSNDATFRTVWRRPPHEGYSAGVTRN